MTIDTNELRRLAQAATPGPWWVNRDGLNHGFARGVVEINANDWHALAGTWAVNGAKPSDEGVANAEFIAAANPAAINELLDRLEAAEKERDFANAAAENIALKLDYLRSKLETAKNAQNDWLRANAPGGWIDNLRIENEALRAKVARMEKQESVATVIKEGDSRYWMSERLWTFPDGKYPLYALPGAKGEEK